MLDHELADGRLRGRIEQLSHADLVRFAMFSLTATRQGQGLHGSLLQRILPTCTLNPTTSETACCKFCTAHSAHPSIHHLHPRA